MADKVIVGGRTENFKNDYGEGNPDPIISSNNEGPHGFSNIIGNDEVPTGIYNMSGMDAPAKTRKKFRG